MTSIGTSLSTMSAVAANTNSLSNSVPRSTTKCSTEFWVQQLICKNHWWSRASNHSTRRTATIWGCLGAYTSPHYWNISTLILRVILRCFFRLRAHHMDSALNIQSTIRYLSLCNIQRQMLTLILTLTCLCILISSHLVMLTLCHIHVSLISMFK